MCTLESIIAVVAAAAGQAFEDEQNVLFFLPQHARPRCFSFCTRALPTSSPCVIASVDVGVGNLAHSLTSSHICVAQRVICESRFPQPRRSPIPHPLSEHEKLLRESCSGESCSGKCQPDGGSWSGAATADARAEAAGFDRPPVPAALEAVAHGALRR